MIRSTAIAFIAIISASADVGASDPGVDVVIATRLAEQLADAREACRKNEQAGDVESIALGSPLMFRGIDPQSPRWPEARAAYMRYAVSTCVPKEVQSYVDLAASFYEETLSEEELKAVLEFYGTDAGKKFAATSSRLSVELNKKMYQESQEAVKQGGIRFGTEMQEILKRGFD